MPTREETLFDYLTTLAHTPYPVQEEALYAWAECDGGVLLSAPTGTGKTLVAEAVVYEALRTGTTAYYSTPLIALTDQKLTELQDTAARWGYPRDSVGLVTGHRTINPDAPVKVVVAEVLLNRLLHPEAFDFGAVGGVVMDEFHNFNDPERGIVWELALTLLPKHVRVMLLSATVGDAPGFVNWMARTLDRRVTLVEGRERKVPLHFQFVGDELLPDFVERIAQGSETARRTPALIFCFDREICWSTADVLRGRDLFAEGQRSALLKRLEDFDFTTGAGGKLRPSIARGVGIHHAGVMPKYRRVVETLFQEKLLPVCVCTETLAAGINLPARSSILTTLVKGPPAKRKLIDVGSAQQMFGRAGRPQYDAEGYVYAAAHEDDVKLAKWKEKYDGIPEDTKDPGLMAAKKALLKKKPSKRPGYVYWNADQFAKLQTAPPAKLASRGRLSWRWLAYLLDASPHVGPVRDTIRGRLMDFAAVEAELKRFTKMLVTLDRMKVVTLDPPPPIEWQNAVAPTNVAAPDSDPQNVDAAARASGGTDAAARAVNSSRPSTESTARAVASLTFGRDAQSGTASNAAAAAAPPAYDPVTAVPTPRLHELMVFRAVHPLYGLFLIDHLGRADPHELIQVLESLLDMPGSVAKSLRVPPPEDLPPGRLASEVIDPTLLTRGLASHDDLYPPADQSDVMPELRRWPIPLASKVRMLFESEIDHAGGLSVSPVWCVGDLLHHGGTFDAFVRSRDLAKQEGIVFKHLLRMILLCGEFARLTPPDVDAAAWRAALYRISDPLTDLCRAADPQSTDETLEELERERASAPPGSPQVDTPSAVTPA